MSAFQLKANRDRNRPMAKMPRPQLEAAVGAYDSVAEESRLIRADYALRPVADGPSITAGRLRLAALQAKTVKAPLSDLEEVERIANARRRLGRQRAELDDALRAVLERRKVPVAQVADKLGVTRQALYQLAS